MELELTQMHHKTQKEYKEILEFYLRSLQYKIGQGFKHPINLLIDCLAALLWPETTRLYRSLLR